VSSGSARRGRRDNGFDAAEYAAAGDVDPRVGEHVLDVLALQRIAAYLQPAVDLNPVTRTATIPARPTDRLFVDRTHLDTARDYLAQLAENPDLPIKPSQLPADPVAPAAHADPTAEPAPAADPIDEAWAQIIAGYHAPVDSTQASWPDSENVISTLPEPPDPPAEDTPPESPSADILSARRDLDQLGKVEQVDLDRLQRLDGLEATPAPEWRRPGRNEPSLLDSLDSFGNDLADEDEGYTPPPPPPLPRISKFAILGVLAIIAGFILFLKPELLPIDSDVSMLLGFTSILVGFGTLIWRLRPGDDEDDYDPDDGARV
jgi:hypothetical protein